MTATIKKACASLGTGAVSRTMWRSTVLALAAAGIALGACRDAPRLDNLTARDLSDPATRHPIGFSSKREALFVEIAPSGEGLSANQEADVYRFLERYKAESTGRLRIGAPASAKGAMAASRSVRQVEDLVRNAGIPAEAVEQARVSAGGGHPPAVRLAYERSAAVGPQCGQWPENLGETRERLPHQDFGCSSQRNLAATVANARDLIEPQEEAPRSSEVRDARWSKFAERSSKAGGGGGSSGSGGSAKPGGSATGASNKP